jgi:hypothetical protein
MFIPESLELRLPCRPADTKEALGVFCIYLSSHVDSTIQLVKVVSNVSRSFDLFSRMSESCSNNDWIWESEAALSLSCEHSVDTVAGANFHAVRISHSCFAAPTQLPVMRSCPTISGTDSNTRETALDVPRLHLSRESGSSLNFTRLGTVPLGRNPESCSARKDGVARAIHIPHSL